MVGVGVKRVTGSTTTDVIWLARTYRHFKHWQFLCSSIAGILSSCILKRFSIQSAKFCLHTGSLLNAITLDY